MYFEDAYDEVSYKEYTEDQESFEYLNESRFNSALCYANMFTEFLHEVLKKQSEYDVESDNYIRVNMIRINNPRYLETFGERFPGFKFLHQEVSKNNYTVVLNNKGTLHELLNFASLFFIFLAITNDEDIFITEDLVKKYMEVLNVIDAPYFVRYLFKLKFIKSLKSFNANKELLEKSNQYKIDLSFGDNHSARFEAIKNRLDLDKNILDFGCGEGYYIKKLSKKIGENLYIAIDNNEEIVEDLEGMVKGRKLDNVQVYTSIKEFLHSQEEFSLEGLKGLQIIMSEVIEHMNKDDARILIDIFVSSAVDRVIITTPNKDFNPYYFEDSEEMRHDDHKFEMTEKELCEWANLINEPYTSEYQVECFGIGDKVNGISTTSGVMFKRISK